jgi:hypothetical protein
VVDQSGGGKGLRWSGDFVVSDVALLLFIVLLFRVAEGMRPFEGQDLCCVVSSDFSP